VVNDLWTFSIQEISPKDCILSGLTENTVRKLNFEKNGALAKLPHSNPEASFGQSKF